MDMKGDLVSQHQAISYIDAMRSNTLITVCRDGILPAINGRTQHFLEYGRHSSPTAQRSVTERIYTPENCSITLYIK